MDPGTAAAFATIVSLLADFVAHRKANEAQSFDEFMAWLSETRHEELRGMLELQSGTAIAIKSLLSESQKDVLEKLAALDKSLAGLASGLDSFKDIAAIANPGTPLSDQAVYVLQQFSDSGASKMLEAPYISGSAYVFVDGPNGGTLDITEERFITDDIDTLLAYGLLSLSYNSSGKRMLGFTRAASAFVKQMKR